MHHAEVYAQSSQHATTCDVITRMVIQAKTPSTLSEDYSNSTNEAEE